MMENIVFHMKVTINLALDMTASHMRLRDSVQLQDSVVILDGHNAQRDNFHSQNIVNNKQIMRSTDCFNHQVSSTKTHDEEVSCSNALDILEIGFFFFFIDFFFSSKLWMNIRKLFVNY